MAYAFPPRCRMRPISQRVSFGTPREARRIGPSRVSKACPETADETWFLALGVDPGEVPEVGLETGRRSSTPLLLSRRLRSRRDSQTSWGPLPNLFGVVSWPGTAFFGYGPARFLGVNPVKSPSGQEFSPATRPRIRADGDGRGIKAQRAACGQSGR